MTLSTVWAGFVVFVTIVPIAAIAVAAVPHARGIEFVPQLRYGLVAPACAAAALGAAFLYAWLLASSDSPERVLGGILAALGGITLVTMVIGGPPGLARAAVPVVLAVALGLSLLVPRFVERPPGVIATVAVALVGMLELVGVVAALASERVPPAGPSGLPFEIPRALFDVDHKFVDLPSGARIHYVDEGKGPILLFLHGNPAWSFQWRNLIAGLRGSFRCVALDYPGFGLSSAPSGYGFTPSEQSRVLEEFVDYLGLQDITLVMQDWGGPIGLGLAGRRSELVRGVVLGSTWVSPTTTSEARGKFSLIAGGPIGEFAQVNFNALAAFAVKSSVVRKLPTAVLELYLRPFQPLDRRGIAAFYPGQITAATGYFKEVGASLPRLASKQALIFWALQDPGVTRSDLEQFEATFPNHTTIELPNASHFFFEDAAPRMVQEITAFASPGSNAASERK
jgi:pimeloyl-ACP methyl ester carboxylesterase